MKIIILLVLIAVASCDDTTTATAGTSAQPSTSTAADKTTKGTTAPPPTTPVTTPTPTPTTTTTTTTTPSPPEPTTLSPPTTPAVFPSDDSKFPAPVSFSINITNTNQTCLQAKMAVQFVLSNGTKFLKLEDATRADNSTCATGNETKIELKLTFGGNNVTFIFMRDEALTSGWLDSIHLQYRVDNVSGIQHLDLADKLFESNGTAEHGKQYHCREEVATKELGGNKVVFKEVEVQVGSSEHGNDLTSCPADEDVNDMIPIAVGAALLALVAIVLVAYFVGRRRSRRLAYQSV